MRWAISLTSLRHFVNVGLPLSAVRTTLLCAHVHCTYTNMALFLRRYVRVHSNVWLGFINTDERK